MNKIIHKHTLSILAVMVMLMATLLTACGSDKTTDTSAAEDTTNVEATKEANSTETTETEEVAEEPALEESAAEPTPEPVVYEGIDMESTLPGLEWIETFNGVIDEPKMVVFNDDTNKKVIVENGQEVEFIDNSDELAIYFPKERDILLYVADNSINFGMQGFHNMKVGDNADILGKIKSSVEDGSKVDVEYKIGVDGEDVVLKATLVIKK